MCYVKVSKLQKETFMQVIVFIKLFPFVEIFRSPSPIHSIDWISLIFYKRRHMSLTSVA